MADTGDFAQAELLARMNPTPDLGVQVRPTPQNVAALDQFRAERQRDFNWRNTFGQIPPADVLRETRDMISLTNRAIEQKMRLAAQTNHEAQNLYIKDQEFQEWQRQAPLRDELLKSQIERRKALTERETDRQIWENRKEAAQARYDTALESFLRDNPEATTDEVNQFTADFASRDSGALILEPVRRIFSERNQALREQRRIAAAGERLDTQIGATGARQDKSIEAQKAENAKRLKQQADLAVQKGQQRAGEQVQRKYESAVDDMLRATSERAKLREGVDSPAVITAADAAKDLTLANLEAAKKELQAARGQAAPAGSGDVLGETVPTVEKVIVIKDGKRFRLPRAQLEEAQKQGYALDETRP